MAHRNKVDRSIETPCGTRCVDIFKTPEGRFGFAEFRRDPEDPSGWHPTGAESQTDFAAADEAAEAARRAILWLAELD